MNANQATSSNADPSNLFPFDGWLQGRGLSRVTGYRYRKLGLISTVNIFGRLYIDRSEIQKFESRAMRGEFNKEAKTPKRDLAAA